MVPDPCENLQCVNTTDSCNNGKCHCGSSSNLACDKKSQFPLCFEGTCVCSKIRHQYEKGDGKSKGSCESNLHKCQSDGRCAECSLDSQCNGLSNKCDNRICVCGESSGPCDATTSSECRDGTCVCGTNPECFSSLQEVVTRENGIDGCDGYKCSAYVISYASNSEHYRCKSQRGPEVCEKITKYYNPLYLPGEIDSDGNRNYTCDDEKGKYLGTYQCLGDLYMIFDNDIRYIPLFQIRFYCKNIFQSLTIDAETMEDMI